MQDTKNAENGLSPSRGAGPLVTRWDISVRSANKARSKRYFLRNGVLRDVTSDRAVAACGKCRRDKHRGVALVSKEWGESQITAWENLQTCGKVWLCPVCSAKVRSKRASEIAAAGVEHLRRGGGLYTMVHSLPHDAWMPLWDSWTVLSEGFSAMCSGRAGVKIREGFGIVGHIKAHEVTVGSSGWHPHSHSLWMTERPLSGSEVQDLNENLFSQFSGKVQKRGFRRPLLTYNKMGRVKDVGDLAVYVAKAANELVRLDHKEGKAGRTPFQVLEDLATMGGRGPDDMALWRDWEKGCKRKDSIRWSRGLKGQFTLQEKTDADLASEQVDGEEMERFEFSDEQWERVCQVPRAQSLMMDAIEQGGSDAVLIALDGLAVQAEAAGML